MSSASSNTQVSTQNNAQPSSILFFIAVAIGVVIALVFIFFSMRYYVRTRLGLYATARITSTNNNGIVLLTGDFAMQTFNMYNPEMTSEEMRRARRRRRFLKKRRLTEEEVEHLFPARTYQNWLEGGAELDADNRGVADILKEENDEALHLENLDRGSNEDTNITGDTNNGTTDTNENRVTEPTEVTNTATSTLPEVDLGNPYHDDMHFDSGTCAICIDTFEPNDQVRGLICGHVFHQECLDPWLTKRKACCPMCKRDYYLKRPGATPEELQEENADVESVANYPELQYTTLSERVAEILQRNPEVETIAQDNMKKYLTFKWRVFWFIMGISKTDLVNSAIVSEDQTLRDSERITGNGEDDAREDDSQQQQQEQQQQPRPSIQQQLDAEASRRRVDAMV